MAVANRTGGQLMMSIFGKNLTTNAVDVYQLLITTGDPITFPMDALSSGNYDYQGVRGRNGAIIGQVQLDEQDPAGEISFSVYEDFDYLGTEYVYGNSKNKMINLFNGEAFMNGSDVIVPIGTNGTDKTRTARAKFHEMNKPYKYLLHNEGAFIKEVGTADPKTGKVSMKKNPYEASFNQSHKTFCMEFMTTTGDGQVNRMLPIIAKSSLELVEGDINQFNLTAQRGCDVFERDDFYTEMYPSCTPVGALTEFFAEYVVVHGANKPTIGAKENDVLIELGEDGKITAYNYNNGSSWELDSNINDNIQIGCRIKSTALIKSGEEVTKVNTFVVAGADKKAVDFSTDGSKRFYCNVYDYDRTKGKFVEYLTAE